jgi:hypothetical protein
VTPDHVAELRRAVERLEVAYERRAQQIRGAWVPHLRDSVEPLDATDPQGRSILLDALTAIVNARTALANAEADR